MTITAPTHADVLPLGPSIDDPDNFDAEADAFAAAQRPFGIQMNSLADNVYANALAVNTLASAADASATAAMSSAGASAASAASASSSETNAAASATAAAASATAAAASATFAATSLAATSTTATTIATGPMTFTTQSGKAFSVGVDIAAVSASDADNAVYGKVASYSGTSLTINVTGYTGSGSVSDWNISVVGQRGQQGATGGVTGGSLTGAINEAKGADLASASTVDIWSGAGNYEVLTGSSVITGFAAAPQAGSRRRLLVGSTPGITAGANMIVKGVISSQTYTLSAGDEIDVYAETTTKFRITINKGDGTAMAGLYGAFQNAVVLTGTGTYVAKKTGWHRITLSGGGARGGLAVGNIARATGASGAGFCVGMRFLIKGQSYNYAQGSAAAAGTLSGNGALNGANGGASSFFGTGIATLTANGGVGGVASQNVGGTLTGPDGGTASGGDINVQGGKAGDVSGSALGTSCAASGGGAVGIMGTSYGSGDVVVNTSSFAAAASGGAGVGGGSGAATCSSGTPAATGGGGHGGASPAATNADGTGSPSYSGAINGTARDTLVNYVSTLMNATAGGPGGNAVGIGDRSGAGGPGYTIGNLTQSPGVFSGAGGIAHRADINAPNVGSYGGLYGGGSAGIAVSANAAGSTTVPGGFVGLVMVEC